jgi:hypothetical protein
VHAHLIFPFSSSPRSASYCARISTIRRRFCQMLVSVPHVSAGQLTVF